MRTRCQPTRANDPAEHWQRRHDTLLASCGIADNAAWEQYVAQVHAARRGAAQPLTRWSPAHLLTALDLAVRGRGWPAEHATTALLSVAADPATRSPPLTPWRTSRRWPNSPGREVPLPIPRWQAQAVGDQPDNVWAGTRC